MTFVQKDSGFLLLYRKQKYNANSRTVVEHLGSLSRFSIYLTYERQVENVFSTDVVGFEDVIMICGPNDFCTKKKGFRA